VLALVLDSYSPQRAGSLLFSNFLFWRTLVEALVEIAVVMVGVLLIKNVEIRIQRNNKL